MHDDSFSPMGARESRKIDDLLTKTRKIMHNLYIYAKIENLTCFETPHGTHRTHEVRAARPHELAAGATKRKWGDQLQSVR